MGSRSRNALDRSQAPDGTTHLGAKPFLPAPERKPRDTGGEISPKCPVFVAGEHPAQAGPFLLYINFARFPPPAPLVSG